MANNTKIAPVAIDVKIQDMQTKMFDGLGFSNINAFGRVYLVKTKENKTLPKRHVSGTDYKDVLINDKFDCTFFCIEDEKTTVATGPKYSTSIEWVFLLNVQKLKPGIAHRADEECLVDILSVVNRMKFFKVTEIIKGNKALEDFDTDLEDREPYHFIKIIGVLKYSINC